MTRTIVEPTRQANCNMQKTLHAVHRLQNTAIQRILLHNKINHAFTKNKRLVHVKLSNNEMPNALGVGFADAL